MSKNKEHIEIHFSTTSTELEKRSVTKSINLLHFALKFVWTYTNESPSKAVEVSFGPYPGIFFFMKAIASVFTFLTMMKMNKQRMQSGTASRILTKKCSRVRMICPSTGFYQVRQRWCIAFDTDVFFGPKKNMRSLKLEVTMKTRITIQKMTAFLTIPFLRNCTKLTMTVLKLFGKTNVWIYFRLYVIHLYSVHIQNALTEK